MGHISQISCDHIADVSTVLPQGSEIKCMVISQDKGKGRIALSTKTLEVEPGDMIKDREKVFENAEDTAAKYQERLEMERKAREEAAQDAIFGLESVFSEPTEPTEAAAEDDLPLAPAPRANRPLQRPRWARWARRRPTRVQRWHPAPPPPAPCAPSRAAPGTWLPCPPHSRRPSRGP